LQEPGARRGKDGGVACGARQASHHGPVLQIKQEGGVSYMAKGNGKGKGSGGGTGAAAASAAGKVLSNPKSSKDDKKAAASDLAQKKPRKS
jgi:hypothetical protein